MTRTRLLVGLGIIALLAGAAPAAAQDADAITRSIRARTDSLQAGIGVTVLGVALQTRGVLPEFYASRDYQAAWAAPGQVQALLTAIRASRDDGLQPRDYLLGPLEKAYENGALNPNAWRRTPRRRPPLPSFAPTSTSSPPRR